MWRRTATSGDWRGPQAFSGTRTNTRELVRSGKKKPQPRTVEDSLLVGWGLLNDPSKPLSPLNMPLKLQVCSPVCSPTSPELAVELK